MHEFPEYVLNILRQRYLRPSETPEDMFARVSRYISLIDFLYLPEVYSKKELTPVITVDSLDSFDAATFFISAFELNMLYRAYNRLLSHMKLSFKEFLQVMRKHLSFDVPQAQLEFYNSISNFEFMPSSPVLMNSGNRSGQLLACFVLPLEDSVKEIFNTNSLSALIYQSGGGVGMSASRIRSSYEKTSAGYNASGPIPFMLVPAATIESIRQAGARKGAAMISLRVDHPDIMEFIKCKETDKTGMFANFNISVAMTDAFWKAFENGEEYDLVDPHSKQVRRRLRAGEVFDAIVNQAHKTGDPGVFFIDRINVANPTPKMGNIESCNPCLTGDSIVHTANGFKTMEELARDYPQGGINVFSWRTSKSVVSSPLSRAFSTGIKEVFEIVTVSGNIIKATSNHLFMYCSEKGGSYWISVADLAPGDSVSILARQDEKEFFSKDEIVSITSLGKQPVFDLTVEETHCFIANNFVVHNCGEVFLLPYESCNLGSINLSVESFFENGSFCYDELRRVTRTAIHFLDNVLDANNYPDPRVESVSLSNRKIGLGVMGLADCFAKLKIPYDSSEALEMVDKIMSTISHEAKKTSMELATVRGAFFNYDYDSLVNSLAWYDLKDQLKHDKIRNALLTAIAPTGTISLIVQASSGIEPIFASEYLRNDSTGEYPVMNSVYAAALKEGTYSADYFKTALQIDPMSQVDMVAAIQKHVDNSISKTVNVVNETSVEVVRELYIQAWKRGCKCITVFRDKSLSSQVLNPVKDKKDSRNPRTRGKVLKGRTYKVSLTQGNLYVTINDDEYGPREVVVNLGKGGTDVAGNAEALGRFISSSFENWIDNESILANLLNINGTPSWEEGKIYLSISDAVGQTLKNHIFGESKEKYKDKDVFTCERCQSPLIVRQGAKCYTCISCGHSGCAG